MFSLKGKTAVVIGGASGIGKAISEIFARQGATVHILELNENAALELANALNTEGGKVLGQNAEKFYKVS
jgi:2-keto-3-deoxy-L-fuconate dehydrogenase